MAGEEKDTGGQVAEQVRPKTQKPQQYSVVLHNDDYTTMQFVVDVLEGIFHKSPAEAHRIMMHVHTRGHGACGLYTHDVAETKVVQVHDRARRDGFPLRASVEEA